MVSGSGWFSSTYGKKNTLKREISNEREREIYIRLMSKGNKMPLGSIFTFEMTWNKFTRILGT